MASKQAEVEEEVQEGIPQKETFTGFLYNSKNGTVLGRTGISWLKIGVFYAIFYACLVGWFAGLLHAFYSSLDEKAPTYYGTDSLLLGNPALGVRPMPIYDSTMIRFAQGKKSSYQPYVDHLEAFLKTYDYSPDNSNCSVSNATAPEDKGCNVDIQGYLQELDCTREGNYGFDEGKPCVALKMNKQFGFQPDAYASMADIDADLNKEKGEELGHIAYAAGNIGISCDGGNKVDAQFINKVTFAPAEGLAMKFFPYMNQKGYRSPIVIAKFDIVEKVTIQVVCKLWATNIDNSDGKQKRGTVHFEFYRD